MTSSECPYGAEHCPKMEDLECEVQSVKVSIANMSRTLYLIAGILTVNLGVTLV